MFIFWVFTKWSLLIKSFRDVVYEIIIISGKLYFLSKFQKIKMVSAIISTYYNAPQRKRKPVHRKYELYDPFTTVVYLLQRYLSSVFSTFVVPVFQGF